MRRTLFAIMLWSASPMLAQSVLDEQKREEAQRHYAAGAERMTREAFEEAAREFRAATQLDPEFFLAYYSLGQAQMALKRYSEAIGSYGEARATILRQSALDARGRADAEQRRRDELREVEDSLQRLRSGQIKGGPGFGAELALEERMRVLKDADLRGVEGQPRVPAELSLALGSAHYRLGHLEDAEREYRAAITVDPRHGSAHNNLAVVCMMTGRFDEAEQELKRAEKAGFKVSPGFRKDLQQRISAQKR